MTKTAWINGHELDRHAIALKAAECGVPDHCCDALAGYITGDYVHIGDFLRALLSNNLKETFSRADDVNRYAIERYVRFLYSFAPSGCWGSEDRVSAWLRRHMGS